MRCNFFLFSFFTAVPKNGPKFKKHQQIKIPTFCGSYIRIDAREIQLNTKVVFCGDLRMDQNGKLVSVTKKCYLSFLTKIWEPENFTFAWENGQKQSTERCSGKVFFLNCVGCFQQLLCWTLFPKKALKLKQNKNQKDAHL